MSSLRTFPLGFPPGNVPASWVPQGVGKTTLLRIILGLEQPDHGTIQGQVRPVSAVFQENRLFEDFSALSNAAVVCPKGDRQEAARHLTALGLADSLSLPVRALSGGMKRRVSIARAVLAPRAPSGPGRTLYRAGPNYQSGGIGLLETLYPGADPASGHP